MARQIVVYTWVMVAASLLLVPVAPTGSVYGVTAVLAARCSCPRRTACSAREGGAAGRGPKPMRLFHGSITYLTLLFLAVAIDPFLPVTIGLSRQVADPGS